MENTKFTLLFIALSFVSLNSLAAGFDCSKASTTVEKLVCSDSVISALDADLNRLYKLEYEKSQDKKIFRETQIIWLKSTRNLCANAECLADAYRERIKDLYQEMELRETGKRRYRIENSFTGTYCANPCIYQSAHRPVDMVCRFTLGEKYIFLSDSKKQVAKKYSIVSRKKGELLIDIEGNVDSWSNKNYDGTHYQLSFKTLAENKNSEKSAVFSSCRLTGTTCDNGEEIHIEMSSAYMCQF